MRPKTVPGIQDGHPQPLESRIECERMRKLKRILSMKML